MINTSNTTEKYSSENATVESKFRATFIQKLGKLQIALSTPGAWRARRAGCYFEPYKMFYRLGRMGISPKTILDIGANRGMFSKCAHYVFPDAFIFAFEPLNDCYEELVGLARSIQNIECYNVAISDRDGESVIHRSSYDYSSSLLEMDDLHKAAFPQSGQERVEKIKLERLDAILANKCITRPLLMKIDVQGYETFVLDGAVQTLQQTDYIICEMSFRSLYREQGLFDEVYQKLVNKGFQFVGHVAELQHPKTGEVLQIDGLFISRTNSGEVGSGRR